MLLEFRVQNFRSIRDEQVLTLVASRYKELADTNLMPTGLKGIDQAVRSVVVYGANASGKTTVLAALAYMSSMVAKSAGHPPGQPLDVLPFKLDPSSVEQPSQFEMTFVLKGVRYQYGFSLIKQRIIEEWLLVYRTAKPQQWFRRTFDVGANADRYEFSSYLTGPRQLWQQATRPTTLFLSVAAQLNSAMLTVVYQWLSRIASPQLNQTTEQWFQREQGRQAIQHLLVSADTGIQSLEFIARKQRQQGIHIEFGEEGPRVAGRDWQETEVLVPQFLHRTVSGTAANFELQEESQGTQRLYGLAGLLLNVLDSGEVLLADELDSSLHPHLVRQLIGLFHNPKTNPHGAQLVFSTHDTSLLDQTLFRRDQIWFTEKGADQATRLYPLTSFSPRKGEALERGYLAGRYGAVPFFGDSFLSPATGRG